MATIKTVKSTLLAIMSRSDFNTVILKAKKRTMQRQCDFLKSFVFFRDLTLIKLQKLLNVLEKKELLKNTLLFEEGDKVNGVYFIQSGDVLYEKKSFENDVIYSQRKWMQPKLFKGSHI